MQLTGKGVDSGLCRRISWRHKARKAPDPEGRAGPAAMGH
nr:MAG TPA: hypothetical protein [Caudoviricetes sp.]